MNGQMVAARVVPLALPALTRDYMNAQSFGRALNAHVKQTGNMVLDVGREEGPELTLAQQASVLLVGAGGIGCELLKDLVLSGFSQVHVVDLDTIDLSNLNRQFLFQKEHIKKSKALVAKEGAQKFNPHVEIIAHHANIKDSGFNIEWFSGFRVVFNALDNVDARRHVNKMCLAADVPLIESGTTGFNGQVQVIKKGVTACYDCTPKEAPKSFPVCTIRSTPSQPIHCIVWGKSWLLNEIFGMSEDESAFDNTVGQENGKEIEELKKESEALRQIRQAVGTEEFPQMLFDKVFKTDILRLRSMEDMWKTKKPPEPLDYEDLIGKAAKAGGVKDAILKEGLKVWSLEENLIVFNDSLGRLSKRIVEMRQSQESTGREAVITFDKDDEDTLDFVAASANIRSTLFGIERKSRFEIKQMAGNIIPAIATTNAIVAGLCVLESFKILRGEYEQTKEVFLQPSHDVRLLGSTKSRAPNPNCPVCSVLQVGAAVDLSRATLGDIVEHILIPDLGYGGKEISINHGDNLLYDVEETEKLSNKLSELGISGTSALTITDDDEEQPFVNVIVNLEEAKEALGDKPVKALLPRKFTAVPHKAKKASDPEANGTDGRQAQKATLRTVLSKRPRTDDAEAAPSAKRVRKTLAANGDDLVVVDDDTGGAIVINDD